MIFNHSLILSHLHITELLRKIHCQVKPSLMNEQSTSVIPDLNMSQIQGTVNAMSRTQELVINYHITEACNYDCQFCYAKWGKPNEIHAKQGLSELLLDKLAAYFIKNKNNDAMKSINYKTVRINFAGGEPMILGKRFKDILMYAKNLGFKLSIITNGSYLTDEFITQCSGVFDMIGISYDSQSDNDNRIIGRVDRKGLVLSHDKLLRVITKLRAVNPAIKIKINTVVNAVNYQDDFTALIKAINPVKWKVFQVLPVLNDNLQISNEYFERFITLNQSHRDIMSIENNHTMTNSYLMINPQGRFYQNQQADQGYVYSASINDTGVERALQEVNIDWSLFSQRYLPQDKTPTAHCL